MAQKTQCMFVIIPEFYHPHCGYELSTIWPGVSGIYGTGYFCGHDLDLAMEWANGMNAEEGYTPDVVTDILQKVSGLNKINYIRA